MDSVLGGWLVPDLFLLLGCLSFAAGLGALRGVRLQCLVELVAEF